MSIRDQLDQLLKLAIELKEIRVYNACQLLIAEVENKNDREIRYILSQYHSSIIRHPRKGG